MDEIKIKFINGPEYLLPDISYENFVKFFEFEGASDMAYDNYLKSKNMKEISDFDSQSIENDMCLVLTNKNRERVIIFKCLYDSGSEEAFDWEDIKIKWITTQ